MAEISKRLDDAIKKHNRWVLIRSIGLTAAWEIGVIAVWLIYSHVSQTPVFDPSACFWTILMVLPFAMKGVHNTWLEHTFRGEITGIKTVGRYVKDKRLAGSGRVRNAGNGRMIVGINRLNTEWRDVVLMNVKTDNGGYEQIEFTSTEGISRSAQLYSEGDEIVKIRSAEYPINLTAMASHPKETFCPYCAEYTDYHEKKCHWCRKPLIQK